MVKTKQDQNQEQLGTIITVQMAGLEPQCFKRGPPNPVLKALKPATKTYNKQH